VLTPTDIATLIAAVTGMVMGVAAYRETRIKAATAAATAVNAQADMTRQIQSLVWAQVQDTIKAQDTRIDELEAQVVALRTERDGLLERVAQLEQRERETQAAMALLRVENEKLRSQIRSGSMRRR
jgi:septal ring factor EnvC (AmiA/AmiB activator)